MSDNRYKFWESLAEDLRANKGNPKGLLVVGSYRVANFFSRKRGNLLLLPLSLPIRLLYKVLVEWVLGVEIPASTQIGKGLRIHHGQGLVVNPRAIIGNNVTLKHNTTIGAKTDFNDRFLGAPVVEDSVIVHPNSVIVGEIVIGKRSIIGAGSVVVKDVPPSSVVVGNPGKVIRSLDQTV
jgi:putative colanic acid biosynthesis acetyltransferase WcaB